MLTGQELTKLALKRLADNRPATLVRVIGVTETHDTTEPAKLIARWRDGKSEPPYRSAIRMLDKLGAINWEALEREPPASAERLRAPTVEAKGKVVQARKRAGGGTP